MDDVGCVFEFQADPRNNHAVEIVMRRIFDAMAEEEFPTGDVKTYTVYRDPEKPGRWLMFEHFTAAGAQRHASGPKMMEVGLELTAFETAPYRRAVLEPVFFAGFGESIDVRRPS